jgi:hypothetical protein
VELVNGQPDSFLHPMAAPRYDRRELVVPSRELSSVPQLSTGTPDALWGDFVGDEILFGTARGSTRGAGGFGGSGYGTGAGGFRSTPSENASSLLELGNLARIASAEGREAHALFVYEGSRRIDLRAHRSALIPFLHTTIDATRITWFDALADGHGRHALRFVNATAQTLPEGTLAVFDHGGFAGEAMLERLKPGERQFVQVGEDLDVELRVNQQKTREQVERLVISAGMVEVHFVRTKEEAIELRNRSSSAREVHLRIDAVANSTVDGADRVDFDAARGSPLAVVQLDAGKGPVSRTLTVAEGLSRRSAPKDLSVEQLRAFADAETLPATEREAARVAAVRREALDAARKELRTARFHLSTLTRDIERLREHVSALGDSQVDTARHPLVVRLVAAEDRLDQARQAVEQQAAVVEAREEAVLSALMALPKAP